VRRLKHELDRRGIVSKRRILEDGRLFGGVPISKGNLYSMLSNPLYIGQIRHNGVCHAGLHESIIDQGLWNETQERLERNRQGTKERRRLRNPASLTDKLFDEIANGWSRPTLRTRSTLPLLHVAFSDRARSGRSSQRVATVSASFRENGTFCHRTPA
jgi:hypothetical protein